MRTVTDFIARSAVAAVAAAGTWSECAAAALTLEWKEGGAQPVERVDLGAASTGGYAVFRVKSFTGRPVLRLAYANHPDGLGEKGDFSRETSARYLGPDFDIPVLPGNINRHEIYDIRRTGLYVAPLIQGQERYVRVQLDTPGTRVELESLDIVNAEVFSTEPRRGSFRCSDERLTRLWDISVWTCQLASFPNHDAWKTVAGCVLPRKLEAAQPDVWSKQPAAEDGVFELEYEFDANPHFPVGTFEVMAGARRTRVTQDATNELKKVSVPVKKGERLGLSVPKESWPVLHTMTFNGTDVRDLANWDFARTRPYIADGAKRDRLIWSGDLWWAERNAFYGFGPQSPYMRGSVRMLAFNRTPEGYVHASPYAERADRPASGEYGPFGSDEFAAWLVPVAWDYYLYTADKETLAAVWEDVEKLMDYLAAHRRADGVFEQRKDTCKHAAGLVFGGTSLHHRAYMNILLWKTLKDAAAIARALDRADRAAAWDADAERLAKTVRAVFWDAEGGFFKLSAEDARFGFEANALALAARFATAKEAARIRPRLTRTNHGKFQALAARGKFEYGDAAGGLKALEDHNWYKLLDPGWQGARTVTECMGMIRNGWGDESHPDTAIAGIYSSYVLGVVPTEPGFKTFAFKPQPGNLTFAEGTVPTPHGDIAARWELTNNVMDVRVTVPAGTRAAFAWGGTERTLEAGTHRFRAGVRAPNYDEAKIPPYTLEDPLAFADGRRVARAADWEARRREILEIFAKEMYGREPPAPEAVVTETVDEKTACAGFAVRKQFRMWFKKDKSGPCVNWILFRPRHAKGPVPVVEFLNYRGNHELTTDADVLVPTAWTRPGKKTDGYRSSAKSRGAMCDPSSDSYLPLNAILARGYAVLSACYTEISPDVEVRRGDLESFAYTGVFSLWPARDESRDDNITALGAWAWVFSRGVDYIFSDPDLDATRIVATGCSRLAKTPLLAAARDARIPVCAPVQTGGGGAPLAKRDYGENVSTEMTAFPHWYCRAYGKYIQNEQAMAFDQHLLLAAVAPRALLVLGFNERWFDTKGEYLAVKAASPVWTFLGKQGMPDRPFPDDFSTACVGGDLGYARRSQGHGISAHDWMWMLDFADGVFARR